MSKIRNEFNLDDYTLREFQTLLIILEHEGKGLPELKKKIDEIFLHKSRTKGYDYINALCKKGVTYKESIIENGERQTKVYIEDAVRRNYEKFIVPTISDGKLAAKELFRDKSRELNDLDLVREKFKHYTELLIEEVKGLVTNTTIGVIKKKRFLKTIENRLWTYFKAEMLKYEFFSK